MATVETVLWVYFSWSGVVIEAPMEPEPALLAILASRQLLQNLAAVLRVPAAHVGRLVEEGRLPATSAAAVALPLSRPLLTGIRSAMSYSFDRGRSELAT